MMSTDRDGYRVYGIHSVSACLRNASTRVRRLYVREGALSARLEQILELASAAHCPVERLPAESLDEMAGKAHQGVVLQVDDLGVVSEDALTQMVADTDSALFLILDGVTDPRNLGACLRSAATMGVHGVILPRDRSATLNAAAIKTSSGGASVVPVVEVVNLSRTLEHLKRLGVWIVGTVVDADTALSDVDLKGNIGLILGAEDKGLRLNTRKHCDYLAGIPMIQDEPGLNVSVAAGICLYEVTRQRRSG